MMHEYLVRVNGIDLYCEVHGHGKPLLLLHGFTGSSRDWHDYGLDWLKGYKLIIPDLRGHGRSTNSQPPIFTHKEAARDILLLLEKLEISACAAIGCSFGGNILLHMASMRSEILTAMILVSATSYFPDQARTMMKGCSFEDLKVEEFKRLQENHIHGVKQIKLLMDQARSFALSYDDMNFSPIDLSSIKPQTLLVQGDRDFLYPVDLTFEIFKALPKCEMCIMPNAGHLPIFGEFKTYFIGVVQSFLHRSYDENCFTDSG